MPLRDHFHPPLATRRSWDRLHAQWPATIVVALNRFLPKRYVAGPGVHLGSAIEIDVATYETNDPESRASGGSPNGGGVATAVWAPPQPTLAIATDPPGQETYEVLVYNTDSGERLVAAVEIVSPANNDRPNNRRAFIAKCASLLHEGVCVAIVDLVTTRTSNLYRELMEFLGQQECAFPNDAPSLYAVALRWTDKADQWTLETWVNPLAVGSPLPTLPLWLAEDFAVPLELESSYEETCRALRIPSV
jgi:hypothetical protein